MPYTRTERVLSDRGCLKGKVDLPASDRLIGGQDQYALWSRRPFKMARGYRSFRSNSKL